MCENWVLTTKNWIYSCLRSVTVMSEAVQVAK